MAVGETAGLEHREERGLLGCELIGNEPCTEVVVDPLFAGFHLRHAKRGANEVGDGALRRAVGVSEGFLVEVIFVLIEATRKLVLLVIGKVLFGLDFREDRIGGLGIADGLLPARTVFVLIDTGVLRSDFDIGDTLAPAVVAIEFNQLTATGARFFSAAGAKPAAGINMFVRVAKVLVVFEKVVDDEALLLDVARSACAATPHLLIENWRANATTHHKVQYLPTIEAGIKHTNRNSDSRVRFALEATNRRIRVCDVRGDDNGVIPFRLRVHVVENLCQTGGMVLGYRENNGFSRGICAGEARRELSIVLMGKTVKLPHHEFIGSMVGPASFKLGWTVFHTILSKILGKQMGNSLGKFIVNKVSVLEGLLNGIGEIRLFALAVIKLVSVSLDVTGGCGGEA